MAVVTPDQILRQQAIQAAYDLMIAWGGNLTQMLSGTPQFPTGGIVTSDGTYRYHTFNSNSNFVVPAGLTGLQIDSLVVAGGGGGGAPGGGGGAGGVLQTFATSISPGTFPVVIGSGGAGGTVSTAGGNGGNSSFNGIITTGGGGGGTQSVNGGNGAGSGLNGGSGGGASFTDSSGGVSGSGGSGVIGQGNLGGTASAGSGFAKGGGGGADFAGGSPVASANGGNGGNGLITLIPGTPTAYGGGGGGASGNGSGNGGSGGFGGGGAGASATGSVNPVAGAANTGGGGGGTTSTLNGGVGAAGGSGVVIIRYLISQVTINPNTATYTSPTATDTSHLPGQPAQNAISGSNVHYNALTDTDSNWWGAQFQSGGIWMIIDLLTQQLFNEIQVYLHPFLPTCNSYLIQGSNDNVNWSTLATVLLAPSTKQVLPLGSTVSFRYVKFIPLNGGSDGNVRVVAINIYNWQDESVNIILEGTSPDQQPSVTLDIKSDMTQNSLATASELTVILDNTTGKYSPFNPSSPIYGVIYPDGRGSGVRNGIPIRLFANASSTISGVTQSFNQKVFEGFIMNDDAAAGAQGVLLDDTKLEATIVSKSLYTRLDKLINVPTYHNMFYSQIVSDICWRCGIAEQDINTSALQQMIPYATFSQSTAISMIRQLEDALPYMRVFETFTPYAAINFTNKGRSRADLSGTVFTGPGRFISTGPYALLAGSVNGTFSCGLWNMNIPHDSVIPIAFPSNVTAGDIGPNINTALEYNGNFYSVDKSNNMWILNPFANVPTWQKLGSMGSLPSGNWNQVILFQQNGYIFALAWTAAGNHLYGYVWNTSQSITNTRALGLITTPASLSSINLFVDNTYAIFIFSNNFAMNTLYVWQHNGTPLTTTFSTTSWTISPAANATENGVGDASNTGKMTLIDQLHNFWYYDTSGNLQYINLASIISGSPAVTNAGNTSSIIGSPTAFLTYGMFGTYLYTANVIVNSISGELSAIISVWDTSKSFSKYTVISSNSIQTNVIIEDVDFYGMIWMITSANTYTGFLVQGIAQWPSSSQYNFAIQTDGFTTGVTMADGNPLCNRIQVFSDPQQAQTASSVFTQSNNLTVIQGVINSFTFQITPSWTTRSFGGTIVSAFGTQRYLNLNVLPITQPINSGGNTATITVPSTAGLTVGSIVQLTGGTTELNQVKSLTATTITFIAVNGSNHTSVSWGQYMVDDPLITQYLSLAAGSQFSQNITAGGSTTTISVANTSGISNGTVVYLNGGTTESRTVLSFIPNTSITFAGVNGSTHTSAQWGQYQVTFFCYADIAYLTINALNGFNSFTLTGMVATAQTITQPTSSQLLVDVRDAISVQMYNEEFLETIDTPFFNDYTMYIDILNNGRYALLFLQELNTAWYPVAQCEDTLGFTDPNFGLNGTLFEVVSIQHKGFTTKFSGKMIQPIYNL